MLNASIGQVYSNYWGAMTEEVFIGWVNVAGNTNRSCGMYREIF